MISNMHRNHQMRTKYIKILGEAMIDSDPNYFVGVPGYEKVVDVMEKKEELFHQYRTATLCQAQGCGARRTLR